MDSIRVNKQIPVWASIAAAACLGLALPAHAEEGVYLSGTVGTSYLKDGKNRLTAGLDIPESKIDYDHGYTGTGAIGYAFGNGLRTDIELGYMRNGIDKLSTGGVTTTDIKGAVDAYTAMVNLWYDLDFGIPLKPFIGVGAGVARIDANNIRVGGATLVNDDDRPFAYQAGAGLSYSFTKRLSASLGYRYFRTDDPKFQLAGGGHLKTDYAAQRAELGLRYTFTPEEQPMPVAQPQQQPKDSDGDGVTDDRDQCPNTPAGVTVDANGCPLDSDGDKVPDSKDKCPNTPPGVSVDENGCPLDSDHDGVPDYLDKCPGTPEGTKVLPNGCTEMVLNEVNNEVNFAFNSAELTPNAERLLQPVAETLTKNSDMRIEVDGHTDSKGSDRYNLGLSRRRAESVKKYLVAQGVSSGQIVTRGFGEKMPVADNSTEDGRAQNRRVEIKIISGSSQTQGAGSQGKMGQSGRRMQ